MSCFLSLKLLATVGSKSRAVTKFRAAAATGAGSNLVRHFSLGQALRINLVEPTVVNFKRDPPPNCERPNNPGAEPSIAVILSGCGDLDGTNVPEAINTMMHISRHNIKPTLYAPTGNQSFVVDHISKVADLNRNAYRRMRDESARMTIKGSVLLLHNLEVKDHLGLIIPGGNGIGTDYFTRRPDNAHSFKMEGALNYKLREFYRHRKPIGFLSEATILAAKVFDGVRITFGDEATLRRCESDYLVDHAKRMNAIPDVSSPYMVTHDTNYNIFSARATVVDSFTYYDLSRDIGNLVDQMVQSIRQHN